MASWAVGVRSSNMKLASFLAVLAASIALVLGHMEMKYPHPRGDQYDSNTGPPDYNLASPLKSATMCGGKPPGRTTATFHGS